MKDYVRLQIEDIEIGDKVELLLSSRPLHRTEIPIGSQGIVSSIYEKADVVVINFDGVHRRNHIRYLKMVEKKPEGLHYFYPPGKLMTSEEGEALQKKQTEEWREALRRKQEERMIGLV